MSAGLRRIAVRRAASGADGVLAVLGMLLVVCALVSGLVAALDPLQQQALRTALAQAPAEDTVVKVVSSYDPETAAEQDSAVRAALQPVIAPVGGTVVRRAETVAFDRVGADRAWTLSAVTTGADGSSVIRTARGRLPRAVTSGPLEVAVPAHGGSSPAVGERFTLASRLGDTRVPVVVVGAWAPVDEGAGRALRPGGSLLVDPETFAAVAPRATGVSWSAVPRLQALQPADLAPVQESAALAEQEVAAADEQLASSLRVENPLSGLLAERSRELVVQRTLLLVPVVVLLLAGAASTVLVAGALSSARRAEEGLMRSRGAGRAQLVGPTAMEAAVLSLLAAAAGPLLATAVIRVGTVRPPLDSTAWTASAVAATVCGASLVLPTAVRALAGDSGAQESSSRRRRRTLTLLLTAVFLVVGLGLASLSTLTGFAADIAEVQSWTEGVDALVVAAPALLLLCVVTLQALVLLPLVLRLAAPGARTRGVGLALGLRFASRATARVVPLALVVGLAAGGAAFAVTERAGLADAREARAGYEVGADVRVVAPASGVRAGAQVEQDLLRGLAGVLATAGVYRELEFVGDVPVEILAADLRVDAVAHQLLEAAPDPAAAVAALREPAPGAALPVVITDRLAERAALAVGDELELVVKGVPETLRVVQTVAYLPTVDGGRAGLAVAAGLLTRPEDGPDEWWLAVEDGQATTVAERLRERPDVAARVLTTAGVSGALAANPRTGGAAFGDVLSVALAGALVIAAVLLCSITVLRRRERAGQSEVLRTLGARRADVTRTLGVEYGVTAGAGAVAGVVAGVLLAALTLSQMTLGPGGGPLVPAPELPLLWAWAAGIVAVLVVVPLTVLLLLARPARRARREAAAALPIGTLR